MDVYAQAVTKAKRTAQNRVVACLRRREGSLVESLCPQSVPTPELANGGKLLKRFGVPDGIRTRVIAVKGRMRHIAAIGRGWHRLAFTLCFHWLAASSLVH